MAINWSLRKTNTSRHSAQKLGNKAELYAQKFIIGHGLSIIGKNIRYSLGEIDIIAEDGNELVFIEVRFRSGSSHGPATESVSVEKQSRLIRAAQCWLQQHKTYQNHYCRFDVVAINSVIDLKHTSWEKNAFQADGYN